MASTVDFAVITPAEVKFEGKAQIVVAPGAAGDLGALPNHAPLLTTLRVGVLRATVESGARVEFAVDAGLMQVLPGKVVVLTDRALAPREVDVEAARAALRDAQDPHAASWALARLEIAGKPAG